MFGNTSANGARSPCRPISNRPVNSGMDGCRYQTVFAQSSGSVAAPTAGLHFTEALLEEIRARGVKTCFLTLHVGLGTFAPVKAEDIADHVMHEERYELSNPAARAIEQAREAGGRVVAVGTTSVRVLESVASRHQGRLVPGVQPAPGFSSIPRTSSAWSTACSLISTSRAQPCSCS